MVLLEIQIGLGLLSTPESAVWRSYPHILANLSAPLPNPPSPSDWPLHALILSPSCLPATARLQTPFPPPLPPTPILPPCPLQSCDPAAPEQFGRLLYLLSKLWLTPVTRPLPEIVPITSTPPLGINFACLALLLLCRPFGLAALKIKPKLVDTGHAKA